MINLDNLITIVGTEEKALYYEKLAIGFINSFLWYKIEETTYIYEDNSLPTELYLPQYPITEIVKIEKNTGDNFNPTFAEIPNTDYRAIGTAGKIINRTYIGNPIKITYKAGFKPYLKNDQGEVIQEGNFTTEIETAITLLIKFYYKSDQGQNDIKSETVDGDKIEFNLPATQLEQINILLSNLQHYDVST